MKAGGRFPCLKHGHQVKHKEAIAHITAKLEVGLSDHLHYHCLGHTLDVIEACERIGKAMGVSEEELTLLRVAAAYHDSGFLTRYSGHEEAGCDIARETLPGFDFSASTIETICAMIMATKVPQEPSFPLAEILCDADLDYLGRDDFEAIGKTLFKEWMHIGIVMDLENFNRIQVKFLNIHHYHTEYSREVRTPVKLAHLAILEKLVATYDK
jgi:uncharacterized protein